MTFVRGSQRTTWIVSAGLIVLVTFLVFIPALQNDFTNFDDNEYVTENNVIREASGRNIKHIFTSYFVGHYQPLTILSFLSDYHLYKLEPFGYHLTNLLLHIANALLVFWLFYLLSDSIPVALITALLFSVHPLRVQSVAWVSERKDVLYAFFSLGAMIAYCYYLRAKKTGAFYYLSLSLFIFSLLSKVMAVMLAPLLLVLDVFLRRKRTRAMVIDKIPFLVLALVFGVIATHAVDATRGMKNPFELDHLHKIGASAFTVMFHLWKLVVPAKLCALYPNYLDSTPALYFFSPILFLLVCGGVWYSMRFTRKVLFGATLFVVQIIPFMQFIRPFRTPTGAAIGDHYVYLASVGICYICAEGIMWLYKRTGDSGRNRAVWWTGLVGIVSLLSVLTFQRCFVWKDSLSLWADIQKEGTDAGFTHINRGYAYYEKGDFEAAIREYNKALERDPHSINAYINRGIVYYAQGKFDAALQDYRSALVIDPRHAKAYLNRGAVYYRMGNMQAAIADYTQAIELSPELVDAYINRGMAYAVLGDFMGAIDDYTQVLVLDPSAVNAYMQRAQAYQRIGKTDQAFSDYGMIIQRTPDQAEAYINRGNLYFRLGDFDAALADYQRGIDINPQHADFYGNRGSMYHSVGKFDEALADYNAALAIDPQNARLYNNRALAYFDTGAYLKSREDAVRAQRLGWQVPAEFLQDLEQALAAVP